MMKKVCIAGKIGTYDYAVVDMASGIIERLGTGRPPFEPVYSGGGESVILPGDFNAHSHPEQSIYAHMVDKSWDLATWCRNTIYKYSIHMTPESIYLGCARAFSNMLMCGVTAVMASFYCHNCRGNDLDRAVIKAARDTGIRLYFGRMCYDMINEQAYPEKLASMRSYYETPEEAEHNFKELLSSESSPLVIIAPALHSFHANTIEAIERGINLGHHFGTKVQFHLSEDEGDVTLCRERYGDVPVRVLDSLWAHNRVRSLEHMFLSDCIHTNADEKQLIRNHHMEIVLNPRMNNRVKAGTAAAREYMDLGVPVYVGTDGEASNDDLSVKNERAYLAQIHDMSSDDEGRIMRAFRFGPAAVGIIREGAYGDFQVLEGGVVRHVFVGGHQTVRDGCLLGLDVKRDIDEPMGEIHRRWAMDVR